MMYSTVVKQILMDSIHKLPQTPENYAVHPDTDFTRNRKIGFKDFLLLLLTMEDDCLREELYRFFGRTEAAPTKAAFYHQRAKLKDDALWRLLQIFNQNFEPTLYKNKYRLVACDGSVADIFRDENDKDTYFEPNNKSPRGFNQIHINALYSILDKQFLDVLIQPARKRNEYRAFCDMVDRILCRTKAKKKFKHPERLEDYRYVCKEVPMDFLSDTCPEYSLSLRIVRIEIAPGVYENLITNLPDIEFDMDELKDLYHLRWSVMPTSA